MFTQHGSDETTDSEKKHNLEHLWTLYAHYWTNERSNYSNVYEKIYDINTIEDFWKLFNNIPSPSHFLNGAVMLNDKQIVTFSFFKEDIKPEWEDEKNKDGCEWCYRDFKTDEELDTMWRDMCLYAIGCEIECNGIRVTYKYNPSGRLVQKTEIWFEQDDSDKSMLNVLCKKFSKNEFDWHYCSHA